MKVIILSAGQGSRLLPLTARIPKCLLPVHDQNPALGLQLRAIAAAGVEEACVVVGFGATQVDAYLQQMPSLPAGGSPARAPKGAEDR